MRELHIPASLHWMRADPSARSWLERLPSLLDAALARWPGEVGAPFEGGVTSWVAPVAMTAGHDAVLKIPHIERENRHEPQALEAWDGDGAIRLLDRDEETGAMLLERAMPGHHLSTIPPDEALDVVAGLLPRLLVPAPPAVTDVADEATGWRSSLEGHLARHPGAVPPRLAHAARTFLDELISAPRTDRVLIHQDLHGDNILAAQREPWLAIDPKPLAANAAFALAPLVRSRELGSGEHDVRRRLHRLSELLGVDRPQAARHTVAQTVAWGFGPEGPVAELLEIAGWLLDETG